MNDSTESAGYFPVSYLNGGMIPLYVAEKGVDIEDLINQVQVEQGISIFYLLADEILFTKSVDQKTKITSSYQETRPRLFKVVQNLVSHSIVPLDNDLVSAGLSSVKTSAFFDLPRIPYSLINDIDDFFREVYRTKGTEAIVIFTYDESYKDSDFPEDGWGIVVPEQTNTSISCKYEPSTVFADIPDEKLSVINQVGTAHSHPGMDAYCSGTDQDDQANFDGIHITFGWKPGSLTTDFHIELQTSGMSFTMTLDNTFIDMPVPIKNPKVDKWAAKVEKTPNASYVGSSFTSSSKDFSAFRNGNFPNLPPDCPFPGKVTLIANPLMSEGEIVDCPVCDHKYSKFAKERGRCAQCQSFILPVDMSIEDLINKRDKARLNSDMLDIDANPPRSIWVWQEIFKDNKEIEDVIYELHEGVDTKGKTISELRGGDTSSGKDNGEIVDNYHHDYNYFADDTEETEYVTCVYCETLNHPSSWECHVCGGYYFSGVKSFNNTDMDTEDVNDIGIFPSSIEDDSPGFP